LATAHHLTCGDSTGLFVFKAYLVSEAPIFQGFYGDLDAQSGHPFHG
jgi:hypothetical protein